MLDDLHIALDEVTKSVKSMIEMYCRTFHTDFNFESTKSVVRGIGSGFLTTVSLHGLVSRCLTTFCHNRYD